MLAHAGHAEGRLAVGLGFGSRVEIEALLRRGWRVLAIDADPAAAELLTKQQPWQKLVSALDPGGWIGGELSDAPEMGALSVTGSTSRGCVAVNGAVDLDPVSPQF